MVSLMWLCLAYPEEVMSKSLVPFLLVYAEEAMSESLMTFVLIRMCCGEHV